MINRNRVKGTIADELICCICKGVLDDPYQSIGCGHMFCRRCVNQWLIENDKCPIDIHFSLTNNTENLLPAPRMIQNMINKIELSCEFATYGCEKFVRKDMLDHHEMKCDFNPQIKHRCECGADFYLSLEQKCHNCVKDFMLALNYHEE